MRIKSTALGLMDQAIFPIARVEVDACLPVPTKERKAKMHTISDALFSTHS